jgi:glycosyltransferase involved in cell wall biosynthesis
MKVLFVNQYYWPDLAATSQMLGDLCEHLARHGHDVHVLCSTGHYDHGTRTEPAAPRYELRNGVHIHRVSATGFGKRSMVGRIIDYLTFHLIIGLRTLLSGHRYDAIVTLTTPPLIGLYATFVRAMTFGHTKHVCWVMDLHPDIEFELGVFRRTSPVPRLLDYLNSMHFRFADRCVALGPHMADRIVAKRVKLDCIRAIPVWGHDLEDHDPVQPNDKFTVMYSGNAGLAHTFTAICQAALRLQSDERFEFLFVGGGRRMREVQRFKDKHNLDNVVIRSYVPREELGRSLRQADIHLISLRDNLAGCAVPSKLYGIMAAARPVVFIGPGSCETADAIRDADCGKALDTDDTDGLIEFLITCADDPQLCKLMGDNARRAFEHHYQPSVCCERWRPLLEELVAAPSSPVTGKADTLPR